MQQILYISVKSICGLLGKHNNCYTQDLPEIIEYPLNIESKSSKCVNEKQSYFISDVKVFVSKMAF